jgi:hypothetical protein
MPEIVGQVLALLGVFVLVSIPCNCVNWDLYRP